MIARQICACVSLVRPPPPLRRLKGREDIIAEAYKVVWFAWNLPPHAPH
jgi:hypothetical protein